MKKKSVNVYGLVLAICMLSIIPLVAAIFLAMPTMPILTFFSMGLLNGVCVLIVHLLGKFNSLYRARDIINNVCANNPEGARELLKHYISLNPREVSNDSGITPIDINGVPSVGIVQIINAMLDVGELETDYQLVCRTDEKHDIMGYGLTDSCPVCGETIALLIN